jgi:type IV secretory pathway VirB6-like protein
MGLFDGKRRMRKEELNGYIFGVVFAMILLMISSIASSRTYDTERFSTSFAASECQIKENNGTTTIIHNNVSYVIPTKNIVVYDAESKEAEQIEISGERRKYTNNCPEFLYQAYYLRKPYTETTTITLLVNRSVYNPK